MTGLRRRTAIAPLWILTLTVFASAAAPPKADPPKVDPAETRVRAILDCKLVLPSYVIADEKLPAAAFDKPDKAGELLGVHKITTTYYDAALDRVTTADKPGFYGVVMEAAPKEGRPIRRLATVFRVPTPASAAEPLPGDHKFAGDFSDLARHAGFDPATAVRQSALIAETLKGRPLAELNRDPRFARLLAGLAAAKAGQGVPGKHEDAFGLDRQYWVLLKRRLLGLDKEFAKPFAGPKPVEGAPARVVREGTPAEAGMKPDTSAKLDAVLNAFAADTDEAFAICVVRHGVIVHHKAYGTRNGQPMTLTTKSWMASITKTMSASLMMQLVDQGVVDLDDRIDKYLPQLRGVPTETPVTIRHLYTHTNGFAKWPGAGDAEPDVEDLVADYYPVVHAGREWAYNGVGYAVGGKLIEAVTGESLPLFYHNHLLAPLGCADTAVVGSHADAQSVPLDIAKFGQMLLNRGAYGDKRFFREETFAKMLPQKLTMLLGPAATKTFGVGMDGQPNSGKFGHGAASAATFHVDMNEDLVVVMTRNKQGRNQDKYNGKIWDAIRGGIEKPADKPK